MKKFIIVLFFALIVDYALAENISIESEDYSVYCSREESDKLYETIESSKDFVMFLEEAGLEIPKDRIMPLYYAMLLDYAKTGKMVIVRKKTEEGNKIYAVKATYVRDEGDYEHEHAYAGCIEFCINNNKAELLSFSCTQYYMIDKGGGWPSLGFGGEALVDYRDNAEYFGKVFESEKCDEKTTRLVEIEGYGIIYYLMTENAGKRFINLRWIDDIDVVTDKDLEEAAKIRLKDYNELKEYYLNFKKDHPNELYQELLGNSEPPFSRKELDFLNDDYVETEYMQPSPTDNVQPSPTEVMNKSASQVEKKNMEETRVVEETHRPADSEKNDNKSGRIGIICAIAGLLTLTVTVVLIIKKIKKKN